MSPWGVTSPCTPSCAAHAVPHVSGAQRARRYAALAGALARGMVAGPRLADQRVMRARARAVLRALGLRLECSTPSLSVPRGPGGPGTLIVADHISWLDVIALLAVEPSMPLAKREVGQWPVFGELARKAGAQFIDRDGLRTLPRDVAKLAATLRGGRSVMVFPQGTTWCTESGGGFRRATFQAAIDARAPVRPVTITYLQHGRPSTVAAFLGDEDFATSLHRVIGARDLTVRVTAHPELDPGERDRRTLATEAHATIRGTRPPVHV
ncbi:lysophospholipid acyltransferase family protein [Streptomyces sp. NPDC053542]|uniref:lysophospholipid acyltransferase family protein n=1 Tax=Streptomyces sp. NPDC053542 TaxID=3365710 RepID=UPI0037D8AE51